MIFKKNICLYWSRTSICGKLWSNFARYCTSRRKRNFHVSSRRNHRIYFDSDKSNKRGGHYCNQNSHEKFTAWPAPEIILGAVGGNILGLLLAWFFLRWHMAP